jgi:hypothetical protein
MPDLKTEPVPSQISKLVTGTALTSPTITALRPETIQNLVAVERESLVTVDGKIGVFTPIIHAPGTAPDPKSDGNISAVITSLRKEIEGLQTEKQGLQSQLSALLAKPTTPEDFATALQHSLDKLQTQLSAMTNPVSNFAVKEFRLETNVQVTVTPLGTVEYRFISWDEKADPGTLSRLTLLLVPVPKQDVGNTFTADFQPQTSIAEIEGITTEQQALLHRSGIDTVGDFLAVGTRARSNIELTALLQTDRVKLAGFLASAQILTLKGIDGPRAAVLVAAGIDSLQKIAVLTPDILIKRFNEQRTKMQRNDANLLDLAEAERWIGGAKLFTGSKST